MTSNIRNLLTKYNNSWRFIYVDYSKLEFINNKIPYANLQNVKNLKDGKSLEKQYYLYLYGG